MFLDHKVSEFRLWPGISHIYLEDHGSATPIAGKGLYLNVGQYYSDATCDLYKLYRHTGWPAPRVIFIWWLLIISCNAEWEFREHHERREYLYHPSDSECTSLRIRGVATSVEMLVYMYRPAWESLAHHRAEQWGFPSACESAKVPSRYTIILN